ncbi:MAG: P-loop NTPase [Deltaproteobacteria bacterium]|nr:P-loop NTPase [Deltaproteobacteria bacterium]
MTRVRVASFHSVKGGVGKSTLAVLAAAQLARASETQRVWLVDLDLTGTSLADVLPLEAPDLAGTSRAFDLRAPDWSGAYLSVEETRARIDERENEPRPDSYDRANAVPFLNDYFMFATPTSSHDVPIRHFEWRLHAGPPNLSVLPSSALPVDLDHTVPLVYDEDHSAFIEARLEWMLDDIIGTTPESNEISLVFDTPPSIPGLSRAVLSLAFRLSRGRKVALAEDDFIPPKLENAEVVWSVFFVSTPDTQDLRAAARWLGRIPEENKDIVTVLLNRFPPGDPAQLRREIEERLAEYASPLLEKYRSVGESSALQLFRTASPTLPRTPDCLAGWLGEADSIP